MRCCRQSLEQCHASGAFTSHRHLCGSGGLLRLRRRAPHYASGTDVEGGHGCKRAAGAYAHQVAGQTGKSLDFGACAGARTKDFYQPGKEAAQLDHLNASTSLVTFSIGGNDAGFSTLFSKCITAAPFTTCSGNKEVSEQVDGAISALAGKTTRADITLSLIHI